MLNADNSTASPSLLLVFDTERYLFNCGEGLQRLALESKARRRCLDFGPMQAHDASRQLITDLLLILWCNVSRQYCHALFRRSSLPDAAARQLSRAPPGPGPPPPFPQVRISRINTVLATRTSTDTLAGLPGLLLTLAPAGPDLVKCGGLLDAEPFKARLIGEASPRAAGCGGLWESRAATRVGAGLQAVQEESQVTQQQGTETCAPSARSRISDNSSSTTCACAVPVWPEYQGDSSSIGWMKCTFGA